MAGAEDLIVIHPAGTNRNKCWDITKQIVGDNPEKRFYIFAFCAAIRTIHIGEYANLKYLTERNSRETLTEILELAREG